MTGVRLLKVLQPDVFLGRFVSWLSRKKEKVCESTPTRGVTEPKDLDFQAHRGAEHDMHIRPASCARIARMQW